MQPLLVAEGIEDLLALEEAAVLAVGGDPGHVAWCRLRLAAAPRALDPPPLVMGDDLLRHGVPAGPIYRVLLDEVRRAQLDGELDSREAAIGWIQRRRGK